MSPASDKFKGLGKLLATHVDKLLIGGMAVALIVIALLQLSESQTITFEPAPPQRTEPKVTIDRTKPEYLAVKSLGVKLPAFEESPYKPLVDFNMYDPKSGKNLEDRVQDCDSLVDQGRKALEAGNLDEAGELAARALAMLPTHKPAKELLAEIESKKAADAAPAPKGPAAAPKAPAPVPK